MDASGVKMVAVGLEQLGSEEFVEERFFDGEVYVDEKKKTYGDLGYKRFSWLSIWKSLFSAASRRALSESRARNISGNLRGDGLQNGGLLIVAKGGTQVLLNHREETPGDHVANDVILEKLGLQQASAADSYSSPVTADVPPQGTTPAAECKGEEASDPSPQPTCTEDVCQV